LSYHSFKIIIFIYVVLIYAFFVSMNVNMNAP